MSHVLTSLDCGCAILVNGPRIWCPTCVHSVANAEYNRISRKVAAEYGYRCCEKGMSLQETLDKL